MGVESSSGRETPRRKRAQMGCSAAMELSPRVGLMIWHTLTPSSIRMPTGNSCVWVAGVAPKTRHRTLPPSQGLSLVQQSETRMEGGTARCY